MAVSRGGVKYRGLTPTLKKVFYRDYRYKRATEGRTIARGKPTGNKRKRAALHHGSLVDMLCGATVDWPRDTAAPVEKKQRSRLVLGVAPATATVSRRRVEPPEVQWFRDYLNREGLEPWGNQVAVWDDTARLGTHLDFVAYCRATDRYVVFELKTGGRGYYDAYSGNLAAPFAMFRNAPRYQHQLQLAFGAYMFAQSHEKGAQLDWARSTVLLMNDELHEYRNELTREQVADGMAIVAVTDDRRRRRRRR